MFTDRFFLGDPSGIAFTGSGRGVPFPGVTDGDDSEEPAPPDEPETPQSSAPTPYARMSAAIAHYHATGQPEMAKRLVDAYARRRDERVRYAAGWDEQSHPRGQPENAGELQLKQRIFALSNAGRDVPQEMLQEATELMRQTGRYDQIDVDDNDERQRRRTHPCHLTTSTTPPTPSSTAC